MRHQVLNTIGVVIALCIATVALVRQEHVASRAAREAVAEVAREAAPAATNPAPAPRRSSRPGRKAPPPWEGKELRPEAREAALRYLQPPEDLAVVADEQGRLPADLSQGMARAEAEARRIAREHGLDEASTLNLVRILARHVLRQRTVPAERRHRGDNPSPEEVQRVTRQETLSILRIEPALGEPLVRAVEPLLDQLR